MRVGAKLVAAALMSSGVAAAAPDALDDFEDASVPWQFTNGPEFPGALGSLTWAEFEGSQALHLEYDFTAGGRYVGAGLTIEPRSNVVAVRFRTLVPPDVIFKVRVQDSTEQWLQYVLERPLAGFDGAQPFVATIDLKQVQDHFGGMDDGTLHDHIQSVYLLVEPRDGSASGTVPIDDLELLTSHELDLDPLPELSPVPANAQHLFDGAGVVLHTLSDLAGLDKCRELGLTWVRTDLFWNQVELAPGEYDFSRFEGLVDDLEARDLGTLFILDYGNDLYGGGPPISDAARAGFINYAKAAVRSFKGRRVRYEFWNEPDNAFWTPPDPAVYASVARDVIRAVHEEDASAEIATGGLSWFDFEFLGALLEGGAGEEANAIGMHGYRGVAPAETLAGHLVTARSMVQRSTGRDVPIWLTEWGYSATQFGYGHSEEARHRQAVFAVRTLVSMGALGLPMRIWYGLTDDGELPDDAQENFGLLQADGVDKPAMTALRALSSVALERQLVGLVEEGGFLAQGLSFRGERDEVLMLWAVSPDIATTVRVALPSAAMNLYGEPLELRSDYLLNEADGPIYLTYPTNEVPVNDVTSAGGDSTTSSTISSSAGGAPAQMPPMASTSTAGPGVDVTTSGTSFGGATSTQTDGSITDPTRAPEARPPHSDERLDSSCSCSLPGALSRMPVPWLLLAFAATLQVVRRRTYRT